MDDEEKLREAYSVKPDGFMFSLERPTLALLSILVADKEIQTLCKNYDLRHMEYMHGQVKETVIVELLTEIATRYRIMSWSTNDSRPRDYREENVGASIVGEKEEEIDLSMHEACNKIIHAKKIEFDVSRIENSHNRVYFNPYIYLYGSKGKVDWEASIDIVLFCNAANQMLEAPFGIEF